jgi:hypothetical protein
MLSASATVLSVTTLPFTRICACAFDRAALTKELASPICTLAMPAPVPTELPVRDSELPALLPTATDSCRFEVSDSALLDDRHRAGVGDEQDLRARREAAARRCRRPRCCRSCPAGW